MAALPECPRLGHYRVRNVGRGPRLTRRFETLFGALVYATRDPEDPVVPLLPETGGSSIHHGLEAWVERRYIGEARERSSARFMPLQHTRVVVEHRVESAWVELQNQE